MNQTIPRQTENLLGGMTNTTFEKDKFWGGVTLRCGNLFSPQNKLTSHLQDLNHTCSHQGWDNWVDGETRQRWKQTEVLVNKCRDWLSFGSRHVNSCHLAREASESQQHSTLDYITDPHHTLLSTPRIPLCIPTAHLTDYHTQTWWESFLIKH